MLDGMKEKHEQVTARKLLENQELIDFEMMDEKGEPSNGFRN